MPLSFNVVRIIFGVLLLVGVQTSAASVPAETFVQKMGDQAIAHLLSAERPLKERRQVMRDLLLRDFDLKAIGRFTLGVHWKSMNDTQKEKFHQIFENHIVTIYTQRFEGYEGAQFQVTKSMQEGKAIKVSSMITLPDRPSLKVDWKIFETSQGLKVLDIFVDGISMSMTQRSEFAEMIQNVGGSVDQFLEKLKQKSVS